jgi:aldehyde dehydrogenase (NAD+)
MKDQDHLNAGLHRLRSFYDSGATRSYTYRREQLQNLKRSVLKHEAEIYAALYDDLKKNKEESWVTEIGFVIAEINHTLKHLEQWMQRKRVPTNLLNWPSKSYIYKEPLGVVLIIGPWNYPFMLLLTPLIGAIAAGNTAVVKPSELAPATAAVVLKILNDCFSNEQLLLVEGEGADIVPRLLKAFRFNHIFFTGSTAVGRKIYEMAASQLVPVTLELGGKSPCIVEADADLRVTAKRIAVTKFSNVGQMCVAPDYLLVHESIYEKLVEEIRRWITRFFSDEAHSDYHYGRIINQTQFERLVNYLEHGVILHGGRYDRELLFIEPTIVKDLPLDSIVMGEEIFGPILPVISFQNFEEAKAIMQRNPDPLAFYLFTSSREKEKQWIESVEFGGGCINNASWHLTNFNLPFGGRGNSGIGAYHGRFSFDVFSHRKAVMKTPTWFDPSFKYPPFEGKLKWFRKIIR